MSFNLKKVSVLEHYSSVYFVPYL